MQLDSIIFSVDGRKDLLRSIIDIDITLNNSIQRGLINVQTFSDGEVCVSYETSVRGKRVYLLSSPNNSDKIMQLNMAIDAAKRAGAKEIIPILPYFPYARQDKKDEIRGPIGAKVMAEMLETRGATSIITFDLHADQIQGFFNIPVMHMEGKYLFAEYLRELHTSDGRVGDMVLCAPDAGAAKRVKQYRDLLRRKYDIDLPIVMIDKTRKKANEIDSMVIIGDVTEKEVVIIDDMVDTGGTLCKAADELLESGAHSVRAIVTHGVLSGSAHDKILTSNLTDFVCSDSLPIRKFCESLNNCLTPSDEYITQISTAKQIYLAISAIDTNCSVEILKSNTI